MQNSDKYPLYLAPMEDVTDPAFRMFCKRFGADRVYTEFVSADALVRSVNRTLQKLTISDDERPVAIQIYGKDPVAMADAAQIVEQAKPDFIDLNFGCPVKKVAIKGAGAGLLRDVPRMLEITKSVVNAVKLPVTAKTRLGWDSQNIIIEDLAEQLQDCGIKALTIHARTRQQMYTGEADWSYIGRVKNNQRIKIPIIANGDINTPERAKLCFEQTGADAVMIGRATFGHPWIFEEIKHFLDYGELKTPYSMQWQIDILKQHVESSILWLQDERKGIVHSRRHFAASPVFKGLYDFKQTRIRLLQTNSKDELFALMDKVVEQYATD